MGWLTILSPRPCGDEACTECNPPQRYSVRLAANDDCWIPVSGFQTWRWYWGALLAARRMRPTFRDPLVVWDNIEDRPVAAIL